MAKIVIAKTKYADKTARKVRLVADLIRGKKALEAMDILTFTSKKAAAAVVIKTLKSAIANATNNFGMDKKELVVAKVLVDDAPMFKRGRAISRGRYHAILKRNCHVTIGVTDNVEEKKTEVKAPVKSTKPIKKEVEKKSAPKKAVKKVAKKVIKK